MVELLKRNHDCMMQKYELFRQRNETLEQDNVTKTNLYTHIKSENEVLADQIHQLSRKIEDLKCERDIL